MDPKKLKQKAYRWCFVPLCTNTSKSTPQKVFVHVPENEERRKKWFQLARRSDDPTRSKYFCCEDHFNLKEDAENYMRFSMIGGNLKLKCDVVPRFFDCHKDRKRAARETPRTSYARMKRKKEVAEMFENDDFLTANKENENQNSEPVVENECQKSNEISLQATAKSSTSSFDLESTLPSLDLESFAIIAPAVSDQLYKQVSRRHKSTQVTIVPHFRSVGSQAQPATRHASCSTSAETNDAGTSPIRLAVRELLKECSNTSISTILSRIMSHSEYEATTDEDVQMMYEDHEQTALKSTNNFVKIKTKMYIGIPNEWQWVISLLEKHSGINSDNIKLTLMKIKLDDTFDRLGDQFQKSGSQCSRIFNSTVPQLAQCLKSLIYFPNEESQKRTMPIAFRANYSHVQSIVDCFEIEIEKPSDAVHQALTWSEYKKCNTIKYLISSTCDGMINYMSHGYGGRVSDTVLFEDCGIMDKLPEGCSVMADRGFKQIQSVLNRKKCTLIRPPSVSACTKPSKEEVLLTRSIASLRIHIERVIRRLREFKLLEPHSCLNHNIMPYIDDVVIIAAALINLQTPIIRT